MVPNADKVAREAPGAISRQDSVISMAVFLIASQIH
jgi:hypothetical protein